MLCFVYLPRYIAEYTHSIWWVRVSLGTPPTLWMVANRVSETCIWLVMKVCLPIHLCAHRWNRLLQSWRIYISVVAQSFPGWESTHYLSLHYFPFWLRYPNSTEKKLRLCVIEISLNNGLFCIPWYEKMPEFAPSRWGLKEVFFDWFHVWHDLCWQKCWNSVAVVTGMDIPLIHHEAYRWQIPMKLPLLHLNPSIGSVEVFFDMLPS